MNIDKIMQTNISESNTELSIKPELREVLVDFITMRQLYGSAIKEVRTKLEILDDEFHVKYDHNPIHHMEYRLKSIDSIAEKLKRKGLEFSSESIMENLTDIAGVRVICNYLDDIYHMARLLVKQDDITLIRTRDYIKNPKPNGYRSLHLVVRVPVFLAESTEYIPVEVQIRTIAMDFWASLEHQLKYKSTVQPSPELHEELHKCAEDAYDLDVRMQSIYQSMHND